VVSLLSHHIPDGGGVVMSIMTLDDWRKAQQEDTVISTVIDNLNGKQGSGRILNPDVRTFTRTKGLTLIDGVLYRCRQSDKGEVKQLVLPKKWRKKAFELLHNEMGHLGRDRTCELFRSRFFFPRMQQQVSMWIHKCEVCFRRKAPTKQVAPLVNIKTSQPMQMLCVDYLSLERSVGGYENILVITDHFTGYAKAIPTRNQTVATTARHLFDLSMTTEFLKFFILTKVQPSKVR